MDHTLPQYLLNLNFFVRVAVLVALIVGIWQAAHRASLERSEKTSTAIAVSAIVLAWFGVAWWFGHRNAFVTDAHGLPTIQYALVIPIVLGLATLLGTRQGRALVVAAPQSWLVSIQVYRALGAMFLLLWAQGKMPGEFAIPAGTGDVIVGLSAPLVAWINSRQSPSAAGVTWVWNVFGIGDLAIAVATGFLTAPSVFQMLGYDRPNELITTYPIVMVPVFLVPLSIILHGASLWKLRQSARRTVPATLSSVRAH